MRTTIRMNSALLISLAVIFLAATCAARRFRKGYLPAYMRQEIIKPNVCAVQEVFGTNEMFFPRCISRRIHKICERKTFVRFQCCPGYEKIRGEAGCVGEKPLEDIMKTAEDLRLSRFLEHAKAMNLEAQMDEDKAFTLFVPNNAAFHGKTRGDLITTDGTSVLLYHIVPGRLNFTLFKRNEEYPTLFKGSGDSASILRVNKYPNGVATVNCARIISPNTEASNGMIHVIDGVLKPYYGDTVVNILRDTNNNFRLFLKRVKESGLLGELRREGPFTIFAPTNEAFEKLSPDVLQRLNGNKEAVKALVRHHIVPKHICGDGIIVTCGLTNMDGTRLKVSCKLDGRYVDKAKLIDHDLVAKNGIVHAINTVLIPDKVKNLNELAKDLNLNEFLNISSQIGLAEFLRNEEKITVFAPTDDAFKALSKDYLSTLKNHPDHMKKLVNYHILNGKIKTDSMVGSQKFENKLQVKIRVNVYRNGIAVDDAQVLRSNKEGGNGVIHTIDKVLIPPEETLMGIIQSDPQLSKFRLALETAGLVSLLKSEDQLTVLAPTNDAFDEQNQSKLNSLMGNPERLKLYLQHHIINRMVIPCEIRKMTIHRINSRQGEQLTFKRSQKGTMQVDNIPVTPSKIASNGILYKVDSFLHCTCNPKWPNSV